MTACIKAGVYDNLLKSLKLRTVSHPLLLRLPRGQRGVGSREMRGCTALFQSTPARLETRRGRKSSFSSSTLRGKKQTGHKKPSSISRSWNIWHPESTSSTHQLHFLIPQVDFTLKKVSQDFTFQTFIALQRRWRNQRHRLWRGF